MRSNRSDAALAIQSDGRDPLCVVELERRASFFSGLEVEPYQTKVKRIRRLREGSPGYFLRNPGCPGIGSFGNWTRRLYQRIPQTLLAGRVLWKRGIGANRAEHKQGDSISVRAAARKYHNHVFFGEHADSVAAAAYRLEDWRPSRVDPPTQSVSDALSNCNCRFARFAHPSFGNHLRIVPLAAIEIQKS